MLRIFCAEGKKAKCTKSPCVSSGDVLRPEPVGRQPVGGGRGEGGRGEGGGGEGGRGEGGRGEGERGEGGRGEGERGEGGRGEGGRGEGRVGETDGETREVEGGRGAMGKKGDEEEGPDVLVVFKNGIIDLKDSGGGTDHTTSAVCVDGVLAGSTTTELNGEITDERGVPLIQRDLSRQTSGLKLEQCRGIISPDLQPSLCARGLPPSAGGEEGIAVTSVMSEEEEGPLDSSMEDLPSTPTPINAPLVTTVDTDGENKTVS